MLSPSKKRISAAIMAAFVLVVSLPIRPATAQIDARPGVRVGVTSTTYGGDPIDPVVGRQRGLAIGVFTAIDVAGPLSVQPEISYLQKGAKVEDPITETRLEKKGYLETAVVAKVALPSWDRVAPTVFVGPSYGAHIHHDDRTWYAFNEAEFGIVGGLGTDIAVGGGPITAITIDARYYLSLRQHADGIVDGPVYCPPGYVCIASEGKSIVPPEIRTGERRNKGVIISGGLVF